ncbi:MAG: hypothetical protein ACT4NX_09305 [Deltaproteobacteria bacterium]
MFLPKFGAAYLVAASGYLDALGAVGIRRVVASELSRAYACRSRDCLSAPPLYRIDNRFLRV